MKPLLTSMRSWALEFSFHAVAWLAVLLAIYFSFMHGQWWPIAVVLVVVLAIDGILILRRWKRKAR